MEWVFQLSNGDRVRHLRNLMHTFGSSYICLWTYSPDLNILYCKDGHFQVEASSSAGVSVAETLFNDYKQCVINVGNSIVPGLAFRDKNPCLELQELDLQTLACNQSQRQFYLTAIFLGCERGEIELGMPNIPQNLEMKMQYVMGMTGVPRLRTSRDEEQQQSSAGATEGAACGMVETDDQHYTTSNTGNIMPVTIDNPSSGSGSGSRLLGKRPPFPSAESTDAALTKAYLAILSSSPPCSSSSSSQSYQMTTRERSAFTSYHHQYMSGEMSSRTPESSLMRRQQQQQQQQPIIASKRQRQTQSLFKRAIAFYREFHFRRIALQGCTPTPMPAATRPTSNQLHHMISERRRREKINDSFQALRSLLPQPTKKDKASVLRTTQEYLSSLKAQVSELNTRNRELEAKTRRAHVGVVEATATTQPLIGNVDETLAVEVIPVADESTSTQTLLVDLQLLFRGETSLPDLVMRVLPFLKQHATIVSLQASPAAEHPIPATLLTFRLRIQGVEWDEAAFITAIRRLLADLTG